MHDRAQKVLRFAVTGALVGATSTTTGCDALSRIFLGPEPEPPTINVPPEPVETINVPPDPEPQPEGTGPTLPPTTPTTPPEPEPNG